VQVARAGADPLTSEVVGAIEERSPGVEVVGNYKLLVGVEGPEGADLLTLQTLDAGDPRADHLQIAPDLEADLGLAGVVVSDGLGRVLYGERWDELWAEGTDGFAGEPLELRINELPVGDGFSVIARRGLPGRALYVSTATGAELRRYTNGFGSRLLGLPIDEELVQLSLPKPVTSRCLLLLDAEDPTCDQEGRQLLDRRIRELQIERAERPESPLPPFDGLELLEVGLTAPSDGRAVQEGAERTGDCREILSPHLVDRCSGALVLPSLVAETTVHRTVDGTLAEQATLVAVSPEVRDRLPGVRELMELHGAGPPSADGAFDLAVPVGGGYALGEEVELGDERIPARVQSFYPCPDGMHCPLLAAPVEVLRLENLRDGSVVVHSRQPLELVPAAVGDELDEVLVYAPDVEQVEAISTRLEGLYPGYSVQFNVAALDKLRRQDARLTTLFNLTMGFSALFLVLALGSLSQLNIERRSRQMAQMLILGFSRRFVRRLIVGEYLVLTLTATLGALGLTSILCRAARWLLGSSEAAVGSQDFRVIVESMTVDPRAFMVVFAVVAVCTWLIALASAHRAAKSDPLNLLD